MTDLHEDPRERLEYLRGQIKAERISWGELNELQGLAEYIAPEDVELLEWAGVPEFPDDEPRHITFTSTIVVDVSDGEDPRDALAAYAASTDLLASFTIQGEV